MLSGTKRGFAVLALCLVAGCQKTAADPCAPPTPWNPPGAKPGQPAAELSLCLKDQAYADRNVTAPVQAVATGVVVQCEVEVDRFEGSVGASLGPGSDDARKAADAAAVQQATAAVTQYRQCPARQP
ncbi:MAG TPA: hypothetical protein VMT68_17285 [Caulobacteraceae bacterium]|nr:hypothetical protein [Caulobacteraceae bacterium]